MIPNRRAVLALGAALPLLASGVRAAEPAAANIDAGLAWRRLFAGADGQTFAWWFQGMMFAHVDGLREFPVVGHHAVMVCRATTGEDGGQLDFRVAGCFSDIDSGAPTDHWDNPFTGQRQAIPPCFVEGPGRYVVTGHGEALTTTLASAATRTNRFVVTAAGSGQGVMLTQIEGTLQGFPRLDGTLPPLGDPAITERQTRIQIVAPLGVPTADAASVPVGGGPVRGLYNHVYDALPPWLGFGERLGSGLSKGVMRRAAADEAVNPLVWAYLRQRLPSAFKGGRLVLA